MLKNEVEQYKNKELIDILKEFVNKPAYIEKVDLNYFISETYTDKNDGQVYINYNCITERITINKITGKTEISEGLKDGEKDPNLFYYDLREIYFPGCGILDSYDSIKLINVQLSNMGFNKNNPLTKEKIENMKLYLVFDK